MLNPGWAIPGDLRKADPLKRCGFLGYDKASGYRPLVLRHPDCIDPGQRAILRLSESQDLRFGGVVCGQIFDDGSAQGHVNWFPVTMTGRNVWHAYSRGFGGDWDLTWDFLPDSTAPLTAFNWQKRSAPPSIHLEFDSRETFKRLRGAENSWWADFWRLVDGGAKQDTVRARLSPTGDPDAPPKSVVVGLFGLDLVHGGHAELHPVYGLAMRFALDSSVAADGAKLVRESWAVMMRNRGNEGNCASGAFPLRLAEIPGQDSSDFRLLIPAPAEGFTPSVTASTSQLAATTTVRRPHFRHAAGGLELIVRWPVAEERESQDAILLAKIDLTWRRAPGTPIAEFALKFREEFTGDTIRLDLSGLGPGVKNEEAGGSATESLKNPDDVYYGALGPIVPTAESDWDAVIRPALTPTPPLDLAPVPAIGLVPPVLECAQVKPYRNPRCLGNHGLDLAAGFASKGRSPSYGIGIEWPRVFVPVPVLSVVLPYVFPRTDVQYQTVPGGKMVLAHADLVAGPTPNFLGLFLTGGATVRVWSEGSSLGKHSFSYGIGTALRRGYSVGNLTVEYRHDLGCRDVSFCRVIVRAGVVF
jgi:hypothetical protein